MYLPDHHYCSGLPVHIFRVAGIYGPGRSALDTVSKYRGDLELCGGDDQAFISRIHVSDISNVLKSSIALPAPGLVLNVADDYPSTRYEVNYSNFVILTSTLYSVVFTSLVVYIGIKLRVQTIAVSSFKTRFKVHIKTK